MDFPLGVCCKKMGYFVISFSNNKVHSSCVILLSSLKLRDKDVA